MAYRIWPIAAVTGNPAYDGRSLRQTTAGVPLAGATPNRPLGLRSGVRPGTPASTVTVAGTTVTVAPFAGAIDVQAAAEAGGYLFSSDANVTKALTAADQNNPRVDIMYVLLNDPAEGNGGTPSFTVEYLAGQAAANPTAPATPTRGFVIAQINVPSKTAGGAATVTWVAQTLVAAGGIVPVRSVAELNALPAYAGMYADLTANADNTTFALGLYRYSGTAWALGSGFTDTGWTALPSFSGGYNSTATQAAESRVHGATVKRLDLHGQPNRNSGNNVAVGDRLATFPAGQRPKQLAYFTCASNAGVTVMLSIDPTTGNLTVYRITGGTATYIMLDGIYWLAEQ